jgi:protein-L-isoaspartate(D-aspartate) O-methyltransferase
MGQQIERGHDHLIDTLCASGTVSADWEAAFRAVPRHLFVPDTVWIGQRPPLRPVLRHQDPDEWLELVHSDLALVTQVDDGTTAPGQPGNYPTSSISQPSLVATMLARVELTQGHRVLEIGTGTGYNAALLAHRLGAGAVTSIEIDPTVAGVARSALQQAGLGDVTVITGDGELGHPPHAPYDRILSTATCHSVPLSWIEQTRPGGRIVTPWATSYHNGVLLHLDVADDGAIGRFAGNLSFMWLREQRIPFGWLPAQPEVPYQHTSTTAHPYRLNDLSASFVIGVLTPHCHYQLITRNGDPYDAVMWLFDPTTGSRAAATITPRATEFPIRQYGPRYLWDEVSAAYDWWVSAGQPRYDRFGLTVTAAGQQVWLDSPRHPVPVSGRAESPIRLPSSGSREYAGARTEAG